MRATPRRSDDHPALAYRCPFCHAEPGAPCRTHRGRGAEQRRPHTRRRASAKDKPAVVVHPRRQALCCVCGQLRTFGRARNNRWENYWFRRPIDRDWHRETGELKCEQCGRVTVHALLHREDAGSFRDHAELMQSIALGCTSNRMTEHVASEAKRKYRQADLPRNPYLHHRYWVNEARTAWRAGQREVTALCGEPMALVRDPDANRSDTPSDELITPEEVRDQEYEDPETGLWWLEMDCVDCLRVSNAERLSKRQRLLALRLSEISLRAANGRLDASIINRLLESIEGVG
jgi:hypothetical protein